MLTTKIKPQPLKEEPIKVVTQQVDLTPVVEKLSEMITQIAKTNSELPAFLEKLTKNLTELNSEKMPKENQDKALASVLLDIKDVLGIFVRSQVELKQVISTITTTPTVKDNPQQLLLLEEINKSLKEKPEEKTWKKVVMDVKKDNNGIYQVIATRQ